MKKYKQDKVTHSIDVTPNEVFVSIGYLSAFIGLTNMRLHIALEKADHIYKGKRRLFPFGKTILYLMENNTFKYSKNLTNNGNKIRQLQGVKNGKFSK